MKVKPNYRIKLLNDSIVDYPIFYKHALITIGRAIFLGDLIQFDLLDFDIILRMNLLHTSGAKIDCSDLRLVKVMRKVKKYVFMGKLLLNFYYESK